jgi:Cu+-exporting ATPase
MGFIAVRDELKPGAAQVVREIRNHGWTVAMVTGDSPATAYAIAKQAGILREQVFAEASPERKPELIHEFQKSGRRVAFVGDGINDAPALEQADLGIAVCQANDISRRAADIVLLRSEITAIPEALGLAHATLRKIRQNLFWAFFYNIVAIPLAAFGFINPMLCAVAMGASDLIVIGNALTLYWWKPFRREKIARAIREHIDGSETDG